MAKHRKHHRFSEATFDSDCLESAEYDQASKTITVTFEKGGSYEYDCTRRQWRELKSAGSVGGYFNAEIKDD
jgi:hypothetical protein